MNEISVSFSQISLLQSSRIGHVSERNQNVTPTPQMRHYVESKTFKKQQQQEEHLTFFLFLKAGDRTSM